MKSYTFTLIIIILMIWLMGLALLKGLDKVIENQDIMLCLSAQQSGNKEYLKKCQCFYEMGDITCLQENSK